ncbi:MAG: hypothetical protein LBF85_11250 [Tannerella sp.]|jgi:hypothetical protein|nr:hypothetical protein [Tannerella sp.]
MNDERSLPRSSFIVYNGRRISIILTTKAHYFNHKGAEGEYVNKAHYFNHKGAEGEYVNMSPRKPLLLLRLCGEKRRRRRICKQVEISTELPQ